MPSPSNVSDPITVRSAALAEAGCLSALALRSKAYWGYSREFLEACRAELSVGRQQILGDDCLCFVASQNETLVGFYVLSVQSAAVAELGALFIEPGHIGRGIGRLLLEHALRQCADLGAKSLRIEGDPHASGFYLAVGAREIGVRPSGSIPGRTLPLFEIEVGPQA